MKKILVVLLMVLALGVLELRSKSITESQAQQIARTFFKTLSNPGRLTSVGGNVRLKLVDRALPDNFTASAIGKTDEALYYVYTANENQGFVIISGEDATYPILAYSTESGYRTDNVAPAFKKWMDKYKAEIAYLRNNQIQPSAAVRTQWNNLFAGKAAGTNKTAGVAPLLTCKWNQGNDEGTLENAMCPKDPSGVYVVTGCVATAVCQIMYYHKYPARGTGTFSYNHPKYGTLSANFGAAEYKWDEMTDMVESKNDAVALINYHVGVAVSMQYNIGSAGGSGAYPNDAAEAFWKYFGYDKNSIKYIQRDEYQEAQWIATIKAELDARRPVEYNGSGSGGGHAFVADGYDDQGKFHINWGWGGQSDGYFTLNALDPNSLGTGGGSGGFNSSQSAIIGIKPGENTGGGTSNEEPVFSAPVMPLKLDAALTLSSNTVVRGAAFSITGKVKNNGNRTLSGMITASVYDRKGKLVQNIAEQPLNLNGGAGSANLTFASTGLASLPDTYSVALYFKPTNASYIKVGSTAANNNMATLVITEDADAMSNGLDIATPLRPAPAVPVQKGAVSLSVSIKNSAMPFSGEISCGIYDEDGEELAEIQTYPTVSMAAGETRNFTFSTTSLDCPNGTYYLAVIFKRDGDTEWDVLGTTAGTQNPVDITITAKPLDKDSYEPNETEAAARMLPVNFTGNMAMVKTTGANYDTALDRDFYYIDLPAGSSYTITGRLVDAYVDDKYTFDGTIAYRVGNTGNFSESFDDTIPGAINIANGGRVYLKIFYYFTGTFGTYDIDLAITKGPVNVDAKLATEAGIQVYPNPANEALTIRANDGQYVSETVVAMVDLTGRTVSTLTTDAQGQIDLRGLATGWYLIQFVHQNMPITAKIWINR
jgi:hypothetical protein